MSIVGDKLSLMENLLVYPAVARKGDVCIIGAVIIRCVGCWILDASIATIPVKKPTCDIEALEAPSIKLWCSGDLSSHLQLITRIVPRSSLQHGRIWLASACSRVVARSTVEAIESIRESRQRVVRSENLDGRSD